MGQTTWRQGARQSVHSRRGSAQESRGRKRTTSEYDSLNSKLYEMFICNMQQLYEASLETSPNFFQTLFLTPLRLRSLAQLLEYRLRLTPSSYTTPFIATRHRLSNTSITTFLREQRKSVHFPGDKYLWFFYLPISWFIVNPFFVLLDSLVSIVDTDTISYDASHVPTFYAPGARTDNSLLLIIVVTFVAAIFGALHVIAWQFYFPTHVEQLLWRIGSLTITAFPSASFFYILTVGTMIGILDVLDKGFGIRLPDLDLFIPKGITLVVEKIFVLVAGLGLVGYMLHGYCY